LRSVGRFSSTGGFIVPSEITWWRQGLIWQHTWYIGGFPRSLAAGNKIRGFENTRIDHFLLMKNTQYYVNGVLKTFVNSALYNLGRRSDHNESLAFRIRRCLCHSGPRFNAWYCSEKYFFCELLKWLWLYCKYLIRLIPGQTSVTLRGAWGINFTPMARLYWG